jgi:hypothetical protein
LTSSHRYVKIRERGRFGRAGGAFQCFVPAGIPRGILTIAKMDLFQHRAVGVVDPYTRQRGMRVV